MNMLLARTLHVCSRSLTEMRQIVSAGTERVLDPHGFWCIIKEEDTPIFRVDFHSQEGPPRAATQRLFTDATKTQQLAGAFGYSMVFDEDGRLERFKRQPGAEQIEFYTTTGGLRSYCVRLAEGRIYEADWDVKGELIRGGVRGLGQTSNSAR